MKGTAVDLTIGCHRELAHFTDISELIRDGDMGDKREQPYGRSQSDPYIVIGEIRGKLCVMSKKIFWAQHEGDGEQGTP